MPQFVTKYCALHKKKITLYFIQSAFPARKRLQFVSKEYKSQKDPQLETKPPKLNTCVSLFKTTK